ncbi:hypothetical protein AA14337_3071 [Acetobacter malorum DSM 14337]|uniref:Uncharacterized protein n=1 Tax=Acetobacter malorum DSM 14337 TaxID=1307910 RepID=A0ABQ0PZG9_9PROT|nr:hypothetical protein [Acetobacter malorum]GBQ85436.1 hypothetical protein AA14337_3071 [Acetobacter malorum DSM 14337]
MIEAIKKPADSLLNLPFRKKAAISITLLPLFAILATSLVKITDFSLSNAKIIEAVSETHAGEEKRITLFQDGSLPVSITKRGDVVKINFPDFTKESCSRVRFAVSHLVGKTQVISSSVPDDEQCKGNSALSAFLEFHPNSPS